MSSLKLPSVKLIMQKYNQKFVKRFVTYGYGKITNLTKPIERLVLKSLTGWLTDFQWTVSNYIKSTAQWDNLVIWWEQWKMTCGEGKWEKSRLVGVREPCKNKKKRCKGMRDAKPPSEQTQLWIRHQFRPGFLKHICERSSSAVKSTHTSTHTQTHTLNGLNESLQSSGEAGCSPSGHIWVFQLWRAGRTPANRHSLSQMQFVWQFVLV